jgi:hypothetical protein
MTKHRYHCQVVRISTVELQKLDLFDIISRMPKLLQLLALGAVVAIAASTPVSHLFKDDEADMALEDSQLFKDDEVDTALEDLEVLADSLEKETRMVQPGNSGGNSNQIPHKVDTQDDPGCCPSGKYGPSRSHCTSCTTAMTSSASKYSNGECRNTQIKHCKNP